MISCTEFIPAYSELFTYLDDNYGKAEVEHFWAYLFEPTGKGIPLINFAKKDCLRSQRIHTHVDEVKCAGVIYDPAKFKGI